MMSRAHRHKNTVCAARGIVGHVVILVDVIYADYNEAERDSNDSLHLLEALLLFWENYSNPYNDLTMFSANA